MILFWIQIHEPNPNLGFLFSQLYREDCKYVISVDGSSTFDILQTVLPDNVIVRRSASITWAGSSQVNEIAESIKFAVEKISGWDFIVNLSASDIAIRPIQDFFEFLIQAKSSSTDAFVNFYGPLIKEDYDFSLVSRQVETREEMIPLRLENRIEALIDSSIQPVFSDGNIYPIMRFRYRPLFACKDVREEKRLEIRRPATQDVRIRKHFITRFGYTAGRSWFIFSRKAAELFVADVFVPQIVGFLHDIICSDESILQIWLLNKKGSSSINIVEDNLRYKGGAPEYIADHLTFKDLQSGAFFARKVVPGKCLNLKREMVSYGNLGGSLTRWQHYLEFDTIS